MRDRSFRVGHASNRFLFEVKLPTFLQILKFGAKGFSRTNGSPEIRVKLGAVLTRFEQARRFTNHFVPMIAIQFQESGIGVFYNPAPVGNDHIVSRLLDSARK